MTKYEIEMPAQPLPNFISHLCKDWKPSKKNPNQTTRLVEMHTGLDSRFQVGNCSRCGEILTRRIS